ncbi:SACOL1771 family peroxiredoxin [Paenibacillus pasadenensis]|uniref:SACOL1771 family peroxiredoxin n=1 Tax=Paenibacillus pasadenensis TaxID=217090 RepID=UPI00203ECDC0|nr:SACOL1771 family peroxiredoxin [Paenibacillus pasadenensis]MCM3745840.1 SACOL1771 family peroxiredoxin [Paenibacillus pasadenensis]
MEHKFELEAVWEGGRNGQGCIRSGALESEVSIPLVMDGPGTGTNPDEMLLGAAATCYMISLAAMLERSGLQTDRLSLRSTAVVDTENGVFTYRSITHRPLLILPAGSEPPTLERAERIALKAERSCMITRALAGNVQVEALPIVRIADDESEVTA